MTDCISVLQSCRDDETFGSIFEEATKAHGSEITMRSSDHTKKGYSLFKQIPKFTAETEFATIKEGISVYGRFIPGGNRPIYKVAHK